MIGNNAIGGRTGPIVQELYDYERPPETLDKLNLRFEEIGGKHSLDIYIRRDRPVRKAMEHFAKHIGGEMHHYRFIFEGHRLIGDETPNQLGMVHDDEIPVHSESVGGG